MTKQQKKEFDNLYDFSNSIEYENIEEEYIENEKVKRKEKKEREKRIKQKNNKKKTQFDFDTETVIGMTNKNNNKIKQEKKNRNLKKQSRLNRKQKRTRKLIKMGILLLIIIGGIVFSLVSPLFNITDIIVNNNIQISTENIISLSQLQKGQNIFKFNKNKVIEDIKTNPYIEDVKIVRPNKIEIIINEREKKFNVEFLNGYIYINNQGYILEISEQKENLPIIQGISTNQEEIVEGNRLDIQDLNRIEVVIQIINICKDYEIEKKVSKIDISDKNNYILYMEEEKKTIHLGDETNLSNKMLYVTTIMNENKDKEGIIYVNGDINGNFKPRFRESV